MGEVDAVALGGQAGAQGVGKVHLVFDHQYAHAVQPRTVRPAFLIGRSGWISNRSTRSGHAGGTSSPLLKGPAVDVR
ncbi:hypothetical protein ACR6C2_09890 [Streptomyces sp. INA 01156]